MKYQNTKFKDLKVYHGIKFDDNRGYFREVFKEKFLKKKLIFWCMSKSKKNVLRGMHLQTKKPQDKFVSVVKGKILDVVIDCRKKSKTYGKHFKIILSDKNCKSLYIPAGFAHGFCGLEKENYIIYNCTNYRHKKSEIGIQYNDRSLKIKWPIKKPIISKKDKKSLSFSQYKNKFKK